MIISRRPAPLALLLIPWAHQAQSNPTAPSGLTAAIVGGRIALEWGAPTRYTASIPGTPQVGGTLTTRTSRTFVDAGGLHHAAFTCRRIPHDGAAEAGIQDATGITCSRSDEDDGMSTNARVPFADHRDRQETLASGPVAYPMGPRQAPQDPQVQAGYPAFGVTWSPHVAGDQMPVLRCRAQSHRVQSKKAKQKLPGNAQLLPLLPPDCTHATARTTFPNPQPPGPSGLIRDDINGGQELDWLRPYGTAAVTPFQPSRIPARHQACPAVAGSRDAGSSRPLRRPASPRAGDNHLGQ